MLHPELAELNKEINNKEPNQNPVESSGNSDKNISQHANNDIMNKENNSAAIITNSNYFKAAAPFVDFLLENETKKQCINRVNNFAVDKFDSFSKQFALATIRLANLSFSLKKRKITTLFSIIFSMNLNWQLIRILLHFSITIPKLY